MSMRFANLRSLSLSLLLGVTATLVTAQTRTIAITRVNVVDVVGGRIVPNSTVTISGDIILSVTQNRDAPANARVVEGQGKFIIPGLWDMHAHIQGSGEAWLQLYVANGVTGIRDMGADLDFILGMRDAVASGLVLGPRIIAAGPILDDAPGGLAPKNAGEKCGGGQSSRSAPEGARGRFN